MGKDKKAISQKIIELKNADLTLRDQLIQSGELFDGYNQKMEALHNHNADILKEIINDIGYPTIQKVGKEANEAAWIVIQHAISRPQLMKKALECLVIAVENNEANPKHLAYLSDRIATFEGREQLYGTQFDWDESSQLSPKPYDNLSKVNERRKAIGLNTLEEQTLIIRAQATQNNELPPADMEQRKRDFEVWRKKAGWIN